MGILKKNIVLFFISLPIFCSGQNKKLFDILPVRDGKVNYHDTIYVSDKSSADIKNKITEWLASIDSHLANISSKERMESMDDHSFVSGMPNENFFTIKWKQPTWSNYQGANNLKVYVWYSIKLTAFENGYYYEISDLRIKRIQPRSFSHPFPSYVNVTMEKVNTSTTEEKAKIICIEVDEEIKKAISSLEQFMKT